MFQKKKRAKHRIKTKITNLDQTRERRMVAISKRTYHRRAERCAHNLLKNRCIICASPEERATMQLKRLHQAERKLIYNRNYSKKYKPRTCIHGRRLTRCVLCPDGGGSMCPDHGRQRWRCVKLGSVQCSKQGGSLSTRRSEAIKRTLATKKNENN